MVIYQWAPRAARYRDPANGRFVSRQTIIDGVDSLVLQAQNRITSVSDDLRHGKVTVSYWQTVMKQEIKDLYLTTQALLKGGWSQLTPQDYDAIDEMVRVQYDYLSDFTTALADGTIVTDGSFFRRARMYASAPRGEFFAGMTELLGGVGYTEQKNVLHPAEHCQECIDITGMNWVPLGSVPNIGDRECMTGDKCTMLYR